MNDRSIDEQLRENAEHGSRLDPGVKGLQYKRYTFDVAPVVRQPLTVVMIATTTALDLVALVVMLKVNLVFGVVMFFISSSVLAIWLLSRIRSIAREGRRR
jgi:hypothetical protein